MSLEDCIAATILTFFATLWLLTTEAAPSILDDRSAAEREFVEVYYLTNAMCYFVGWAWVSCLRDLATLVARFGAWLASCLYMPLRVQDTGSYAGEILCMLVFGPGLTLLLIRGSSSNFLCGPVWFEGGRRDLRQETSPVLDASRQISGSEDGVGRYAPPSPVLAPLRTIAAESTARLQRTPPRDARDEALVKHHSDSDDIGDNAELAASATLTPNAASSSTMEIPPFQTPPARSERSRSEARRQSSRRLLNALFSRIGIETASPSRPMTLAGTDTDSETQTALWTEQQRGQAMGQGDRSS